MRREKKMDRGRKKEVKQFWKLCKGLGQNEEFACDSILADRQRLALDNGNRRAARAPTLADLDRGEGHVTDLKRTMPLIEARQC